MALELKFSKDDDTPWGFRLTGGADCDLPLTAIKVAENSLAEKAGLQINDVIVRIDDISMAGLTHTEAHEVLLSAGRNFIMGIRRGENINNIVHEEEMNNQEICNIMESSLQQSISVKMESTQEETLSSLIEIDRTIITPTKSSITDEQIAEAISAEAEVLPEQNVLGVNFNKVDLSSSTVLKVLEEQKEDIKVDLTNKKWSTFLQTPQRPRVIPKKKGPEGPKVEPYRPLIRKQKKKNVETTEDIEQNIPISNTEEDTETATKIEQTERESPKEEMSQEEDDIKSEPPTEEKDLEELKENENSSVDDYVEEENTEEKQTELTSPTSLSLEEQLAQVQQQLAQLAQLPSTIQVTLDAVTQQLAKIVKASNRRAEEEVIIEEEEVEEEKEETISERSQERDCETASEDFGQASEEDDRGGEEEREEEAVYRELEEEASENELKGEEETLEHLTEEEMEKLRVENEKSTKEERKILQEHYQRRLEQRPTQPLTPLQRPIILPGGRKWCQPDDAVPVPRQSKMSDEKICETIETYSEIITGHTKGLTTGTQFGPGRIKPNRFTGMH